MKRGSVDRNGQALLICLVRVDQSPGERRRGRSDGVRPKPATRHFAAVQSCRIHTIIWVDATVAKGWRDTLIWRGGSQTAHSIPRPKPDGVRPIDVSWGKWAGPRPSAFARDPVDVRWKIEVAVCLRQCFVPFSLDWRSIEGRPASRHSWTCLSTFQTSIGLTPCHPL